jgi:hypothetical protein
MFIGTDYDTLPDVDVTFYNTIFQTPPHTLSYDEEQRDDCQIASQPNDGGIYEPPSQPICHARFWIQNSCFRYRHKTNLVSYSLPPFPNPFFYPIYQIPSLPHLTSQPTNPAPPSNRLLEQKLLVLHNRAKTAFTHQFSPMFTPTTSSPAPSPAATPIAAALASVELIALTADGAYALGLAEEGF